MKASDKIIQFIADQEGFRGTAYQPIEGDKWTVGYGFTYLQGHPVQEGDTITQQEALNLLGTYVQNVATLISKTQIPLDTTQNQFDAVVSLTYNIGIGNWMKSNTAALFYAGQNISEKFKSWDLSGGRPVQGLLNRRLKEQAIYDNGDYSV